MSQYSPVVTPTEGATFEVQDTDNTWHTLPGTASISESGNEAPTREVPTFGGVSQQVGNVRPPTIEVTISAYTPLHISDKILRDALINNTLLNFRYTFKGSTIRSFTGTGNTITITTAGVVSTAAATGAGGAEPDFTDEEYGPGQVIRITSGVRPQTFVISAISATGEATVEPAPNSEVAAAEDYSIILPSVQRPAFVARVSAWSNVDAGSEAQLATSLSLAPTAVLPRMVMAT